MESENIISNCAWIRKNCAPELLNYSICTVTNNILLFSASISNTYDCKNSFSGSAGKVRSEIPLLLRSFAR